MSTLNALSDFGFSATETASDFALDATETVSDLGFEASEAASGALSSINSSNPGTTVTPMNVASGVGATFNAYSNIMAADMKAEKREFQLEQKRKDLELQTEAERLQARQKQSEINEQLDDAIAQQKAMQSARNVAIGTGSPQRQRTETVESAQEAKQRIASNFRLNRIARESQIDQLKINEAYVPSMIEQAGVSRALSGIGRFGMSMAQDKIAFQRKKSEIGGGN